MFVAWEGLEKEKKEKKKLTHDNRAVASSGDCEGKTSIHGRSDSNKII